MKLTLLGTGGPYPQPDRHAPAALLEVGASRILVDAGRGTTGLLIRAGVRIETIDTVLITHHHFDHIHDLADVILNGWLAGGRTAPLRVVGPPGTQAIVDALLTTVYGPDIAWRLARNRHFPMARPFAPPRVDVSETPGSLTVDGDGWTATAIEVEHGRRFFDLPDWWSLGFRVEAEGKVVAFSGDAGEGEGLDAVARNADVFTYNVPVAESFSDDPRFLDYFGSIFAYGSLAGRVAASADVGTLVLTHFETAVPGQSVVPDDLVAEVRRRFKGRVVVGEDLLELEV